MKIRFAQLAFCTAAAVSTTMFAQTAAPIAPVQVAGLVPLTMPVATESAAVSTSALPDAPSSTIAPIDDQAGVAPATKNPNSPVASKYSGIILPGQTAMPMSAGTKVVYGFTDAFSPFALVGITVSAGYSHLVDSAPHYGTNSEAFGKREGVAALRSTVQSLATDSLFAPIFHDDPRYYELGRSHGVVPRALYAVSRVVVTRSDSGHNRVNAPLLLGYGVAAGLNNLYYPDRDTGGKSTATSYAGSLGGAALGMVVNEFLDDALRIVHIRRN